MLLVLVPVLIIALSAAGAYVMIKARQEPEVRPPETPPPLVRVAEVESTDVRFTVTSQGTVRPRTETTLVPEVSGRVIEVSPSLVAGGFFENGDVLLRIESGDYERNLITSRSQVRQAELRLAQEEAEAEVANNEWKELYPEEVAPPLTSRSLQLAEARAALEAAKARVLQAEEDLDRTVIRAPFAGRVRDKRVDLGQFVTRGQAIAEIYSVDRAEVRLPIRDRDLAFVDLPLVYRGDTGRQPRPRVILRANFAGAVYEWEGHIDRTEGEIDAKTRMVHAVAVVDDPYSYKKNVDRPPLAAGMFVEAEILGTEAAGVVVLPRSALRDDNRVLVIDGDQRLRFREIEISRIKRDRVIVQGGLTPGERVCVTPLTAVTDGMKVRTRDTEPEAEVADGEVTS
jgi:RND family efflux transporter MFP subunit